MTKSRGLKMNFISSPLLLDLVTVWVDRSVLLK
jgi:hypothetical protein